MSPKFLSLLIFCSYNKTVLFKITDQNGNFGTVCCCKEDKCNTEALLEDYLNSGNKCYREFNVSSGEQGFHHKWSCITYTSDDWCFAMEIGGNVSSSRESRLIFKKISRVANF